MGSWEWKLINCCIALNTINIQEYMYIFSNIHLLVIKQMAYIEGLLTSPG